MATCLRSSTSRRCGSGVASASGSTDSTGADGSSRMKVVPSPLNERTRIIPCIASTSLRAVYRPRPAPPTPPRMSTSIRKNGSNRKKRWIGAELRRVQVEFDGKADDHDDQKTYPPLLATDAALECREKGDQHFQPRHRLRTALRTRPRAARRKERMRRWSLRSSGRRRRRRRPGG